MAGPALPPGAKKAPAKKSGLPFAMKEEVRVLRTEAACTAADEAALRAMDADAKAKLEKKTQSFLSEYSTSYDHREALLCIGELECPAYHWTVARSVLVAVCESFKQAECDAYVWWSPRRLFRAAPFVISRDSQCSRDVVSSSLPASSLSFRPPLFLISALSRSRSLPTATRTCLRRCATPSSTRLRSCTRLKRSASSLRT